MGAFLTKDMPVYVNNVDGVPIVPKSRAGYGPYAASLIWSKAGYKSERLFNNNRMQIMKFLYAKGEVGQNDNDFYFYKTEQIQWKEFKEEFSKDPNVQQFYGGYYYNSPDRDSDRAILQNGTRVPKESERANITKTPTKE